MGRRISRLLCGAAFIAGAMGVPVSSALADDATTLPTVIDDGANKGANLDAPPPADDHFGWDFSVALTSSIRLYTDDHPFPDILAHCVPGLTNDQFFPFSVANVKLTHTSADGRDRFTLDAYGRYSWNMDSANGEGMTFDVGELNYFHDAGSWNFLVGAHKVFWGVAESRHLVDVINQTDLTGDPKRDSKLGQPMVNVNFTGQMGTLSLYGLFMFREQDFSGAADRLPLGYVIDESRAHFEDGDWHNAAFAARYSNTVNFAQGSLDYALSFFTGTARNPRFKPKFGLMHNPPIYLEPYYDHIDQIGGEWLYTWQRLQLKLEGIYRRQHGKDIYAAVGGFEYTLDAPFSPNVNVGLVGEYSYDSRGKDWADPASLQGENSLFAGLRLTANDGSNANILAGVSYNLDDDSQFFTIDMSRRITDSLEVSAKGRFFNDIPKDSAYHLFNKQDYLELSVTKYF